MCDPIGFEPTMPKGMTMPEGYQLDAWVGMGERRAYYHWTQMPDASDSSTWRFGPDESDKRKAVRQAWRDSKAVEKASK